AAEYHQSPECSFDACSELPNRIQRGCRKAPEQVAARRNVIPRVRVRQIESDPLLRRHPRQILVWVAARVPDIGVKVSKGKHKSRQVSGSKEYHAVSSDHWCNASVWN